MFVSKHNIGCEIFHGYFNRKQNSMQVSYVAGLILQGAHCRDNRLSLSDDISTRLPLTLISWVHSSQGAGSSEVVACLCQCVCEGFYNRVTIFLLCKRRTGPLRVIMSADVRPFFRPKASEAQKKKKKVIISADVHFSAQKQMKIKKIKGHHVRRLLFTLKLPKIFCGRMI